MFLRSCRLVLVIAFGSVVLPGLAHAYPTQCKTVFANQEWQSTDIFVARGEWICLKGQGFWTWANPPKFVGPNGDLAHRDSTAFVPGAPIASLVYRIGAGTEAFVAGEESCFEARTTGTLDLAMNDVSTTFGNNIGQLKVGIARTPAPATFPPGLLPSMIAKINRVCFGK